MWWLVLVGGVGRVDGVGWLWLEASWFGSVAVTLQERQSGKDSIAEWESHKTVVVAVGDSPGTAQGETRGSRVAVGVERE